MNHRSILQALAIAAAVTITLPVLDAGPAAAQEKTTPQQQRMKDCNATAGSQKLTGDARKTFMSNCLSGDASGAPAMSQQDKMKSCNARASQQELKGDARKNFMSSCLKG
jgi:hypothetical protein